MLFRSPSPSDPRSASKAETPAYMRVLRAYLRNAASPAVWAPLAVIALLLALSADYWQSLTVLDEDAEASLVSENVSELAETVSEASSIAAAEIDSSDVLSELLSQSRLPVMADDNSVEQAEARAGRVNLEEVDLLGLPDLSGEAAAEASADGEGRSTSAEPTRRFGLLDLINPGNGDRTAADSNPARAERSFNFGRTATETDAGDSRELDRTPSRFSSSAAPAANLAETPVVAPAATQTQFGGVGPSTFTGYPYSSGVPVPGTTGSAAPAFTGYPTGGNVAPVAPTYGSGYTGYPAPGATQTGNGAPSVAQPQYTAPNFNSPNGAVRSEEHTSELQSPDHLVCRLLLEKKKCLLFVVILMVLYIHVV